jgi:hypothetical protein
MKEAEVGGASGESKEAKAEAAGLDRGSVAAYLRRNEAALHEKERDTGNRQVAEVLRQASESLAEMAAQLEAVGAISLEDVERRLTVLEEKINAALMASASEAELLEIRTQAYRDLAPYRRQMTGPQIEQLQRQYISKRLLERWALPRLSLFYM